MTGQVISLRKQPPRAQVEEQLIGAALELGDPLREALDHAMLPAEYFGVPAHRGVWDLICRMAKRGLVVSPMTVFSAGLSSRLLNEAALGWLETLRANNRLGVDSFRQVAETFRMRVRGDRIADQLDREVRQLREGEFFPNRLSGALESVLHTLSRDYAPDETAEGDVLELSERWAKHEDEGTSALLSTGIKVIDEAVGGLPPALTIIAGKPGGGKTAVLCSMLRAMLEADPNCTLGLFGLEDGTSWFTRRIAADLLNMKLREVGWKKRTVDQLDAWQTKVGPYIQGLASRLIAYKRDSISNDELIRRCNGMVYPVGAASDCEHVWLNGKCSKCGARKPVTAIFVDHLGEIDNRGGDYWQNVAETVRRCRNFAITTGKPMVVLCHTTDDGDQKPGTAKGKEGPPNMAKMAGGRSIDRRARLMLGLWSKGEAWRGSVLKANELGAPGGCFEFARLFDAVLIDPAGGRQVNLVAERAAEARDQREKAELESDDVVLARKQRRAQKEAKLKAEEEAAKAAAAPPAPKEEAPQLALLEVPASNDPREGPAS